jgi:hypothetical protein
MKQNELKSKIRSLAKQILTKPKENTNASEEVEYYEFYKFPELKSIIVTLLTPDFNAFMSSVDWVAPRPTTFRINLKNDHSFYLMWNDISWIAQVEGKKYYLLNLSEEQHAAEAISRILKYGAKETPQKTSPTDEPDSAPEPAPEPESTPEPEPTPEL